MPEKQEQQTRDIQREMVYQNIKNPLSRELLRRELPTDTTFREFDFDNVEKKRHFRQLLKNEGGNLYTHLLGIATVAQNPRQLSNAITSFGVLSSIGRGNNEERQSVDQAQNEFLGKTYPPVEATSGARALEASFVSVWESSKNNPGLMIDRLRGVVDPNTNRENTDKYLVEAFILTMIDKNVPVEFKKSLLVHFGKINIGNNSAAFKAHFDSSASVWKNVDASWVLPELFGAKGFNGDPRDREIAELRYKLRRFQDQEDSGDSTDVLKSENQKLTEQLRVTESQLATARSANSSLGQENYRLNQSNMDLRAENERLRRERNGSSTSTSKPSPFMRLGIDRSEWDRADLAGKRTMLDKAYRPLLMKYHPDLIPAVKDSPVVKELVDANMAAINIAVADLELIYDIPKKV